MKYFIAVLALLPTMTFAAGPAKARAHTPSYTPSGQEQVISPNRGSDACGLGWQVTDKRTLLATVIRGTTNSVVSYGFGMTSGTMGCEKHEIAKKDEDTVRFVATNIEPLSVEMAEGQGEFLHAFARSMGCGDQVVGQFGQMTQKNYQSLIETQSGVKMFKEVKRQISQDPVLSQGCVG